MKNAVVAAALVSSMALAGCSTPQDYNAGRGAVIGGTTGALIGGLATGRPGGALAGAAIGAGSGAILGAAATPRPLPPPPVEGYGEGPGPRPYGGGPAPKCAKMGYDEYGEPVCLKLAGYPRY